MRSLRQTATILLLTLAGLALAGIRPAHAAGVELSTSSHHFVSQFSAADGAGAFALLGQRGWAQEDANNNPLDNVGNVRARSVIKLGLFIVTIIGGIIAFVIRLATGRSGQPSAASGSTGPVNSGPSPLDAAFGSSTAATAAYMPQTPPKRNSANTWIVVLSLFLFGGCMLFGLLAAAGLGIANFAWRNSTANARAQAAANADRIHADIAKQQAAMEAAMRADMAKFDARWKAEEDRIADLIDGALDDDEDPHPVPLTTLNRWGPPR